MQLKGFAVPHYRLRVRDWRLRYRVEDKKILILRAIYRREAYRESGFIRQGVPDPDGFDDIGDSKMPESGSD